MNNLLTPYAWRVGAALSLALVGGLFIFRNTEPVPVLPIQSIEHSPSSAKKQSQKLRRLPIVKQANQASFGTASSYGIADPFAVPEDETISFGNFAKNSAQYYPQGNRYRPMRGSSLYIPVGYNNFDSGDQRIYGVRVFSRSVPNSVGAIAGNSVRRVSNSIGLGPATSVSSVGSQTEASRSQNNNPPAPKVSAATQVSEVPATSALKAPTEFQSGNFRFSSNGENLYEVYDESKADDDDPHKVGTYRETEDNLKLVELSSDNGRSVWNRLLSEIFLLLVEPELVGRFESNGLVVEKLDGDSAWKVVRLGKSDLLSSINGKAIRSFGIEDLIDSVSSNVLRISIEREGVPIQIEVSDIGRRSNVYAN